MGIFGSSRMRFKMSLFLEHLDPSGGGVRSNWLAEVGLYQLPAARFWWEIGKLAEDIFVLAPGMAEDTMFSARNSQCSNMYTRLNIDD